MQVPFGQHLSYLKKGPVSLKKHIFSASKAQEFLRLMSDTMEAGCECLPDCELMDLQHSVSTSKLMWVRQPFSDQKSRQCDSRNLNVNPLCMLKAGPLSALWSARVSKWKQFWIRHAVKIHTYNTILRWQSMVSMDFEILLFFVGPTKLHGSTNLPSATNCFLAGKRDLRRISSSLLHFKLGKPNEEEAQGQPACRHSVNGKALNDKSIAF